MCKVDPFGRLFKFENDVFSLLGDEEELVSAGSDGRVLVWNIAQAKVVSELAEHKDSVTSLSFCYDLNSSMMLVSTSSDGNVKIWRRNEPRSTQWTCCQTIKFWPKIVDCSAVVRVTNGTAAIGMVLALAGMDAQIHLYCCVNNEKVFYFIKA